MSLSFNTIDLLFDEDEIILINNIFEDEGAIQEAILLKYIHEEQRFRNPNIKRNRQHTLDFINSWSDDMFKRQFRLCREDFTDLLSKMINKYPGKSNNGLENLDYSYEMGRRSSGTCVPLEIKLYIT